MFLQTYIPVFFYNSNTRCYKLRGLTDHSTDATVRRHYRAYGAI